MGPLARVRHSDVKDGLVIRVEITARHRQVLMASHTLEKVQLDAGVGHPGQRRVSQGGPGGFFSKTRTGVTGCSVFAPASRAAAR